MKLRANGRFQINMKNLNDELFVSSTEQFVPIARPVINNRSTQNPIFWAPSSVSSQSSVFSTNKENPAWITPPIQATPINVVVPDESSIYYGPLTEHAHSEDFTSSLLIGNVSGRAQDNYVALTITINTDDPNSWTNLAFTSSNFPPLVNEGKFQKCVQIPSYMQGNIASSPLKLRSILPQLSSYVGTPKFWIVSGPSPAFNWSKKSISTPQLTDISNIYKSTFASGNGVLYILCQTSDGFTLTSLSNMKNELQNLLASENGLIINWPYIVGEYDNGYFFNIGE